jgi:hypothetical protein
MKILRGERHKDGPRSMPGRPAKYPFATLEINDSFVISKSDVKSGTIRSAASMYGKRIGKTFSVVSHETTYEIIRIA